MKKQVLMILLSHILFAFSFQAVSQVSISNDGTTADPSAALDVISSTQGLLPPRMALAATNQSAPVTSPATGLIVFNTAAAGLPPFEVSPGYYYWNGAKWISIQPPQGSTNGNLMFWTGTKWALVAPGKTGQKLQLSQQGIPLWTGPTIPSLTTDSVTAITQTTATGGGKFTSDGGALVSAKGVCWSTIQQPTIADNLTNEFFGTTDYTSNLTGLQPTTRYFVRAYATNSVGTGYGGQVSFATTGYTPPVTTSAVSGIGTTSASSGGQPCAGVPTVSYWGVTYNTVKIAHQCWLKENLNIGTRIDGWVDQTNNAVIEKYCYDNLESNCDIYGGLYQWAELVQYLNGATNTTAWSQVPTGDIKGICPEGWHIPTWPEWNILTTWLDGEGLAGGKMKEADLYHWASPNSGATNSSGFTGLPGGYASFGGIFQTALFWTSTENSATSVVGYKLFYNNEFCGPETLTKSSGYSVRCLKNQ